MNDFEKQFEQIVAGLNIDDRPNAEHKKALRQQMLAACEESSRDKTAPRIQPIWSRIMKSNITKSAVAAVIIIGVFAGIYQITGSIDGATPAFAQVTATMKEMPWMHMVTDVFWKNETNKEESWYSFDSQVEIHTIPNGNIVMYDLGNHQKQNYSSNKNIITITSLEGEFAIDAVGTTSPADFLAHWYEEWSNVAADIDERNDSEVQANIVCKYGRYNGQKAEIYELTLPRANGKIECKIIADVKTHLPVCSESVYTDSYGKTECERTSHFSFPETGPQTLYDLGVSVTAKVFDQIELKRAEELFAAGDVKALAALFESGNTETKLAVTNYLARLHTPESQDTLKTLTVEDNDTTVQEAVKKAVESIDSSDATEAPSDPNTATETESTPQAGEASGKAEDAAGTADEEILPDVDNDKNEFLGIQVVDAESGQPIEGALLKSRGNILKDIEKTTNQFGRVLYETGTQKVSWLTFTVKAKGYVPKYLEWRPDSKGIAVPKQYLVQMNKSVPVGGYVKTEAGEPIEGVSVNIYTDFTTQYTEFNYIQETIRTDKDGRWFFEDCDPDARPYIGLSHPDYVSMDQYSIRPNIELLLNQTCVLFMQPGLSVAGHVRTPDGTPIEGATLYQGWSRFTEDKGVKTDAQGYYAFEKCHEGSMILTVVAKGYAPELKEFVVHENLDNVDFALEPGYTLPVQMVDVDGNPVKGVKIEARYWRRFNNGQKCESIRCSATTGTDGRAVLNDLPEDEVLYTIRKSGYATLDKYPLLPSDEEQVITLWPKGKLKGNVYDADTGEIIPEFTMTEGIQWQGQEKPTWQTHAVKHFDSGRYEQPFNYHTEGFAVRIEAEGYPAYESETFWNEGKEVTLDVYLNKSDGTSLLGVVYDPDGKPAAKADVLVVFKGGGNWLRIENGRFDQTSRLRLITNQDGEFILPPQGQEFVIIVLHDSGVSRISEEDLLAASGEIHLEKWGHVEGTVYSGRTPDVNCEISIQSNYELGFGYEYNIIDYTHIYSDDQGRFSFHRVLPGQVSLSKVIKLDNNSSEYANTTSVEVLPGETIEVHLGGGGRTVIGRLLPPSGINIDFTEHDFDIMPNSSDLREKGLDFANLPEIPLPQDYFLKTPEQMQAWQTEWMQTPAGQEYMKRVQSLSKNVGTSLQGNYPVIVDEKGNFQIPDVLPGNYTASGRFRDPALNRRDGEYYNTFIAQVNFEFAVEDAEDEKEFEKSVNIGQFAVEPLQNLKVGLLAPAIAMKDLDGTKLSLQKFRGSYVLLDLEGSHYLISQNQEVLDIVKQVYTAYHPKGNLDVLSIISGSSFPASWTSVKRAFRYFFDQKEIRWTVAFEDTVLFMPSQLEKDYTVDGKKAKFVLIAPDGTVTEIMMETDNLVEKVKEHLEPLDP